MTRRERQVGKGGSNRSLEAESVYEAELSRLEDSYSAVSVHGILPLAIDAVTGALRFARLGDDHPGGCLVSPDGLPAAETDLFIFRTTSALLHWKAGVEEVSGNGIEVVLPEARWQRAVLLIRHDRPRRPGPSLEEAIQLRHPLDGDLDPASIAALGMEMRRDWLRNWMHERDGRTFSEKWSREIEVLRNVAGAVDVGRAQGEPDLLSFTLSSEDGFLGVGTSFRIARDGTDYRAYWSLKAIRLTPEAGRRVDAAAEAVGITREGCIVSMRLRSFTVVDVARLGEIAAFLNEVVEGPAPASSERPSRS